MRVVGISYLKTHLSEISSAVEAGEIVEITKRGRSIAQIVPVLPVPPNRKLTPREIAEAIESIDRMAEEIGKYATPGVTVEQIIKDMRS